MKNNTHMPKNVHFYSLHVHIANFLRYYENYTYIYNLALTQVGFAEFNNTADNRANIGGTIIGAPIVGQ